MATTPVIVVGVGGTGMKALLHLKKLIALHRPGGMASLPALRLICIDSDDLIKPGSSPDPDIPVSELALDPTQEYQKLDIPGNVSYADLDRARAWFPRELEYYIPDLSTGCKQYKALGRLLFSWNYPKVLRLVEPLRGMVDSSLLKTLGVTQVEDPLVFVISSLCGGTGAGMFIDVAYMLSNLWKRKWTRFNTKVCALLALPSVFADISQGTERIRSNAYASLKELDHFMNKDVYTDSERAFRADYPYVEHPETYAFAPFDRVFLFDGGNGRVSVSSAQIYEMMARYVYLMVSGELAQEYNSIDNNLNPKVRGTYRLLNKPTCYSSFGYYSVAFPKRVAVQLAAADLAYDLVQQELTSALAQREIDDLADAFMTANKVAMSAQSPQILHALSFYNDSTGHRANIQDTIGSTIANIDLQDEPAEGYEAIVREYDTRFSNADLMLFENDCRREAQRLLRSFRANLEAEIQRLNDPQRNGGIRGAHLFIEELAQEMTEDVRAIEGLAQQTEKQIPALKSALETQFLKLRETATSRSLFSLFNLKRVMGQILAETRETLESFWLARRKAVIARHALFVYKGDAQSAEPDLRRGALDAVLRERDEYRRKAAILEQTRELLHETLRGKRSVPDGEFSKVVFDFERDVAPVVAEVKSRRRGLDEARRRLRSDVSLGSDLDGLLKLTSDDACRCLVRLCSDFYEPIFASWSLDDPARLASLGDLSTMVKTWLNFSRPFLMIDTVDSSKYGFSDAHNAARFIAIPNTYAERPCERILNRCPASSASECDRYGGCLKRTLLDALPAGTSVGHMTGRHEMHFLSLYHGIAASSLIQLISDSAGIYRNHMLGNEKIHMLGPVTLYDLKEPLPNKELERLKDRFYLSFALGWIVWDDKRQEFRFKADADIELGLPPSVALGSDIGTILDGYHAPDVATSGAVRGAFDAMERRLRERGERDARAMGEEALSFVKSASVPSSDEEKRRIYSLGRELSEGKTGRL
ncbi:MAG: hypothetical protein JXO72_11555 [Vicinamibacteria bacterium]|nr:hypothetical protein [Vicinamibacteria bacterium]